MKRLGKIVPDNIRKIPWSGPQPPGFTAFGKIYLRDSLWKDYLTGNPGPVVLSVIKHEQTHTERGLKVFVRYWLDREYRFQEELLAIEEEMKVLKQHGEDFDIERRARDLSSISYLWCVELDEATKALQSIWDRIEE